MSAQRRLEPIEAQLREFIAEQRVWNASIKEDLVSLEDRLRTVERVHFRILGGVAAVSALMGLAAAILPTILRS